MKVRKILLVLLALGMGWVSQSFATCGNNCTTYKCWKMNNNIYGRYTAAGASGLHRFRDDPANEKICVGVGAGQAWEMYLGNEVANCAASYNENAGLQQCTGNFDKKGGSTFGCASCDAMP